MTEVMSVAAHTAVPAGMPDRSAGHDLIPVIAERLPMILEEVRDRLAEQHRDYARFLAEHAEDIAAAAAGFLGRLIGVTGRAAPVAHPGTDHGGVEEVLFEEIGRQHSRQGQPVTSLLSAYQVGASVAWRHVAEIALAHAVGGEAFAGIAGALFAAVDHLSTASLRGYLREENQDALARTRHRDELAQLLVSAHAEPTAVRAAAARAGWTLPRHAAVILIDPDTDPARESLARLEDSNLPLRLPTTTGAIIADPAGPGRREHLSMVLRGAGAVVGPTVSPEGLARSLRYATTAAGLRATLDAGDAPLFVDDHLDALIVHRDPQLLAALRQRCLAPLDGLTDAARDKLVRTLTSWLRHHGNRQAIAGELHIHPQTVRYRVARLRELFGAALEQPAGRASLLLAVGWGAPCAPRRDDHGTLDRAPDALQAGAATDGAPRPACAAPLPRPPRQPGSRRRPGTAT